MTPTEWTELVVKMAGRVADKDFQRSAWFGHGPMVSSPLEDFLGLFDDALLSEFLASPEILLSDRQRSAAASFSEMLENYFKILPDNPEPIQVFEDPMWTQVRTSAREFVSLMEG